MLVEAKTSVSVLGSEHSSSRIFEDETVIDLGGIPTSLEWSAEKSEVTVSGNMTLRDFLLELSKEQKALPATGGTDEQTVAGVLATNTAPATKDFTIYSGLVGATLLRVCSDGKTTEEVKVKQGDPMFKALVANLGLLGVVVDVTFKPVPNCFFETTQKIDQVDKVLKDLAYGNNQFWRIDWIPESDNGLVWAAENIGPTGPEKDYPPDESTKLIKWASYPLGKLVKQEPFMSKFLAGIYDLAERVYGTTTVSGPLRNMIPVDRYTAKDMYCTMAEWAFHPDDVFKVKGVVQEYFTANKWPNLPSEIEPVQCDDNCMSAWAQLEGRPSAFLMKFNFMYLTSPSPDAKFRAVIENHLRGLWDALRGAGVSFRAHWGKVNFTTPEDTKALFQWDKFALHVQKQFVNKYWNARLPTQQ